MPQTTPDELLLDAACREADAERLEGEAARLRREARALREAAKALTPAGEPTRAQYGEARAHRNPRLPHVPDDVMFGTRMQSNPGIVGAKPTDHPFTRALRAQGLTVTAWASKKGLNRQQVKSWYTDGGGRRIPREMADLIEEELKVPATLRVWKNGIREPSDQD